MKKALITIGIFLVCIVATVAVGFALEPSSSIHAVDDASPCPVTGCASGECHGFDNVPIPDGNYEMVCPEVGCVSTECHAWDSLIGRYHQASDASLNLWVIMPVALVVSLLVLVRVLSRPARKNDQSSENVEVKSKEAELDSGVSSGLRADEDANRFDGDGHKNGGDDV